MLTLQLKSGEYITIGDDIVVQVFREGPVSRLAVKAPREMAILRGEVLERTGGRPDGLRDRRPNSPSRRSHNAAQLEKLAARQERQEREEAEKAALIRELTAITDSMDSLAAAQGDAATRGRLADLRSRLTAVSAGN